tara:strand:- start:18561 stop:18737 length:177 start_codon:yes stop_codon:yes gene_type:complete
MVNSVQIELSTEDVSHLYQAVCDALKYWPGGDPEQQEYYRHLKIFLFSIVCEISYEDD